MDRVGYVMAPTGEVKRRDASVGLLIYHDTGLLISSTCSYESISPLGHNSEFKSWNTGRRLMFSRQHFLRAFLLLNSFSDSFLIALLTSETQWFLYEPKNIHVNKIYRFVTIVY
jgi:hypothetical protein